jgi:hypothetical protein
MAKDYKVGYGRPPHHSRFKKGQSGNPAGRPSGSTNVQTEMKRLLVSKTKIKVNGTIQTVPTSRALCLAQVQKGLSGDVRAFAKIVEIVGPEMVDELKAVAAGMTETDLDIVTRALARKDAQPPGPPVEPAMSTEDNDDDD